MTFGPFTRGRVWPPAAAVLVTLVLAALFAPVARAGTGDKLTGTEQGELGSAANPVEVATECAPGTPQTIDINWGDGQHTSGTALSHQEFCWFILGHHAYGEEDAFSLLGGGDQPYQTTVTVQTSSGNTDVSTGSATIGEAALASSPVTGDTALTGVSTSVPLMHFTDAAPEAPSDYGVQIDWGDGSATDTHGSVVASGAQGFDVSGTHTYTAPGTYHFQVSVFDSFVHFTTQKGDVVVSATGGATLTGQEGVALPPHTLVAQFCNPATTPSNALIKWGDGAGFDTNTTISQVGSCYQVFGTHTYAEESASALSVHVVAGISNVADGSAHVGDAQITAAIDAQALSAKSKGLPAGLLAHVGDANADAPRCQAPAACDLSAQIDWGDGAASTGTIQPSPGGGFDVVAGSHTFPGPGSYGITVSVNDKGGASARAGGVYTAAPPPAFTGCNSPVPQIGAVEGLFGQPLDTTRPNWGISPDDHVLRYGRMVLCAPDDAWTYDGLSSRLTQINLPTNAFSAACPPKGCIAGADGGVFETTGRVIVNGLELEPENSKRNTLTVDTKTGAITGLFKCCGRNEPANYTVYTAQETRDPYPAHASLLGRLDLTNSPWLPSGDTLGYLTDQHLPPVAGFRQVGAPRIRIDGLGRSATDVMTQLPGFFRTDWTQPPGPDNPPPTQTTTLDAVYPGLAPAARDVRARAADGGTCPPPPSGTGFDLPSVGVGPLEVGPVHFGYDGGASEWRGAGDAQPLGMNIGVGLGIKTESGFDCAHGDFHFPPGFPVGGPVLLTDLGFGVGLHPTLFTGSLGGTIAHIIDLNSNFFMVFATPDEPYRYDIQQLLGPGASTSYSRPEFDATAFGVAGGLSFEPIPPDIMSLGGHALVVAEDPRPYVEVGGSVHIQPPSPVDFLGSADGSIIGVFGSDTCTTRNESSSCQVGEAGFLLRGQIGITVLKVGHFDGIDAVISSYGVAVCTGYVPGMGHIGFGWGIRGHHTQIFWPFEGGCDTQDWRPNLAAATSAAGATVRVPRGKSAIGLQIVGRGAPPRVALTGPGGATFAMPAGAGPVGHVGSLHFLISKAAETTYVGLWPVKPGTWHVTTAPGSAPIAQVFTSLPLPPARVSATVSGSGATRLLHYHVLVRPNQQVLFRERGPGADALIGAATGSSGTLQFTPQGGPAGRRSVYAEISVNNLPSPERLVAHFVAPPPPRPARPRGLHLTRRRDRLVVSFAPVGGAREYVVAVSATNGLRVAYRLVGRRHTLSIPGFATAGASVRVTAVDQHQFPGPAAAARLPRLAGPARLTGLRMTRKRGQIVITWNASARAVDYRIKIQLGVARPELLATARHSLTLKPRDKKIAVAISVTPQGADGSLGRGASGHLNRARR